MSMFQKFIHSHSSGELTLMGILAAIFILSAGINVGRVIADIFL